MAYGNAIVPQVAYEIFKVIGQIYDNNEPHLGNAKLKHIQH